MDGTRRLGIEHEFFVSSAGRAVDFRNVIHGLGLGQPNLDPADPNAYRLPSGSAVTADGAEAEIALPPISVRPNFTAELLLRIRVEREALAGRLGQQMRLEGCSTHLSVSVPDDICPALCRLYAATFSLALMLLMDRHHSPGLLVRPRPGRVELGAEYVDGSPLAAAALFAVGSVLACQAALLDPSGLDHLPPRLPVVPEPALARYGWYVDRTAFGPDLYATGRGARLHLPSGETLSAQEVLAFCWALARVQLNGLASPAELALVDEVVAGDRPLPLEEADNDGMQAADKSPSAPPTAGSTAHGAALRVRKRGHFEVAPVMLTWDLSVFLILDRRRGRRAFAAVPGADLGAFLARMDAGQLDAEIVRFLSRRLRWRRLRSRADVVAPSLFDRLGPRMALLPAELGPDGLPLPVAA